MNRGPLDAWPAAAPDFVKIITHAEIECSVADAETLCKSLNPRAVRCQQALKAENLQLRGKSSGKPRILAIPALGHSTRDCQNLGKMLTWCG